MGPRRYKRSVLWLLFRPLRNLPWCGIPLPAGYKTRAQFLSCGGTGLGLRSFAFPEMACLSQLAFCAPPPGEALLWSPAALLGERQEAGCWCWWVSPCHLSPSLCVWWWLGQREGIISSICVNVRFLSEISVSSVLILNLDGLYKFIILFVASIVSNRNESTFQETVFFPSSPNTCQKEGWSVASPQSNSLHRKRFQDISDKPHSLLLIIKEA